MAEEQQQAQVSFKVPPNFLVYLAIALGGGGAVANHMDSSDSASQAEKVDRAAYTAVSMELGKILEKVTKLEGRIDVLEKSIVPEKASAPTGSAGHGDSVVHGAVLSVGGSDVAEAAIARDSIEARLVQRIKALPSYDMLKLMAQEEEPADADAMSDEQGDSDK